MMCNDHTVAQHISGLSQPQHLLDFRRLKNGLIGGQACHRIYEYRRKLHRTNVKLLGIGVRFWAYVNLLRCVGNEFHRNRPRTIMLDRYLDRLLLILAFVPEKIKPSSWDGRKYLSRD